MCSSDLCFIFERKNSIKYLFDNRTIHTVCIITESVEQKHLFDVLQDDGTYETRSQLVFTATRYENGEVLTCEGDNPVMQENHEKPMRDTLTLEVLCEYQAPEITFSTTIC